MKKTRLKIPFKAIAFILALSAAIYFFTLASNRMFASDYFKIKHVMANDKNIDLSFLLGRNIFSVNLRQEAGGILAMNPAYHKINLVRRLPDSIIIELKKREPLAIVRFYRFFCVDSDAVLFNPENNSLPQGLPVIYGLETKISGPKAGNSYRDSEELVSCLDLIRAARGIRGLKGYSIKKISVTSPESLSLYILENIEIKVGAGNIPHKLRLLSSLLVGQRRDLGRIKYIDLRFKEPVVKYKDEK